MMKNIYYLLVMLAVLLGAMACTSDDNDSINKNLLFLEASSRNVELGDAVNFTIKAQDKEVDGAKVYLVDGEELSEIKMSHTFDRVGDYNVMAKKPGYKDSYVIQIKVTESLVPPTDGKKLELKSVRTEYYEGEEVKFTAHNGKATIKEFALYLGGKELEGEKWIAEGVGTHDFIAKAEGYEDSNPLEITVLEKEKTSLILDIEASEVFIGEDVAFIVTDIEDKVIKDYTLYLDDKVVAQPWKAKEVGQYTFTVQAEGYKVSNSVTITVKNPNLEKLALTASTTSVGIGGEVIFSVTPNDKEAEIVLVDDKGNNIPTTWSPTQEGTYIIKATSKKGLYLDSDVVTITVIKMEKSLKIRITNDFNNGRFYTRDNIRFEVLDQNNKPIDAEIVTTEFSTEKILNKVWETGYMAMDYVIHARKAGYQESEKIKISILSNSGMKAVVKDGNKEDRYYVGDPITFQVLDSQGNEVKGFQILDRDDNVLSNPYTATKASSSMEFNFVRDSKAYPPYMYVTFINKPEE